MKENENEVFVLEATRDSNGIKMSVSISGFSALEVIGLMQMQMNDLIKKISDQNPTPTVTTPNYGNNGITEA